MKVQNSQYLSTLQMQDRLLTPRVSESRAMGIKEGVSFQDILAQKSETVGGEVKFSKHAANRLVDRNIRLTQEQMERLNGGMKKAGAKGIRDSLVMVDQLAFIVNIPNNTVVTAMDKTETGENVFTNIDGAVIV